jgi:hypothetical protein
VGPRLGLALLSRGYRGGRQFRSPPVSRHENCGAWRSSRTVCNAPNSTVVTHNRIASVLRERRSRVPRFRREQSISLLGTMLVQGLRFLHISQQQTLSRQAIGLPIGVTSRARRRPPPSSPPATRQVDTPDIAPVAVPVVVRAAAAAAGPSATPSAASLRATVTVRRAVIVRAGSAPTEPPHAPAPAGIELGGVARASAGWAGAKGIAARTHAAATRGAGGAAVSAGGTRAAAPGGGCAERTEHARGSPCAGSSPRADRAATASDRGRDPRRRSPRCAHLPHPTAAVFGATTLADRIQGSYSSHARSRRTARSRSRTAVGASWRDPLGAGGACRVPVTRPVAGAISAGQARRS